jgi:hypothetical protein
MPTITLQTRSIIRRRFNSCPGKVTGCSVFTQSVSSIFLLRWEPLILGYVWIRSLVSGLEVELELKLTVVATQIFVFLGIRKTILECQCSATDYGLHSLSISFPPTANTRLFSSRMFCAARVFPCSFRAFCLPLIFSLSLSLLFFSLCFCCSTR